MAVTQRDCNAGQTSRPNQVAFVAAPSSAVSSSPSPCPSPSPALARPSSPSVCHDVSPADSTVDGGGPVLVLTRFLLFGRSFFFFFSPSHSLQAPFPSLCLSAHSRNEIHTPSFRATWSMALLAPSDWHPPRDHTMEVSANSTIPRQRSSPANDHASAPHPPQSLQQHAQPPYPYPVQQPQGSWNPSVSAQPFYPSFYQNQHQQLPTQPYPLHPHPSQNHYFDPAANAQLAQWAYQQMMFNAQAQMGPHPPIAPSPQRSGSASAPASPAEYFSPNQLFNHFPSGTPPPHQQHPPHHAPGYTHRTASADTPRSQPQYEGFHPYRRPPNAPGRPQQQEPDRRPPGSFQPPYARGEASDSSTSVNSSNSNHGNPNGNSRQRTSSIQGQPSSHSHPNGSSSHQGSVRGRSGPSTQTVPQPPPPGPDASRSRAGSGSSAAGASTANPSRTSGAHPLPHHRTSSSSSSASSAPTHRPSASISTSSTSTPSSHSHHPSHTTQARPTRPSPLSQGSTYTTTTSPPQPPPAPRTQPSHASAHADTRRISRDDSDLATMLENSAIGLGGTSAVKSGGLKGRLRRALSLNAAQALHEEDESPGASSKATGSEAPSPTDANDASSTVTEGTVGTPVGGNSATTNTTGKKRSRAASLFNSRLNASTDNISLSSTMSSASVVIRKIGSIGKLARRNSLAGITSLFKDKKDKEKEKDGDVPEAGSSSGKKPKKKKDAKGSVAEPAVSHAVAELDRGSGSSGDWSDASLSGLSPAAKLARQHTLKSNAEAAARAKAAAEAQAQQAKNGPGANGSVPVPSTWEKNTTTAKGDSPGPGRRISEDGTRVVVEEDSDSGSEDGHGPGFSAPKGQSYISDDWDDDEPWPEAEDDTIRVAVGPQAEDEEVLEWANTMRRSIDRSRAPAKGILKGVYMLGSVQGRSDWAFVCVHSWRSRFDSRSSFRIDLVSSQGAEDYSQDTYIPEQAGNPSFNRIRSNSYNSHPASTSELGPLARIPSPDPDHIDGLHRHPSSHSNANTGGNIPSLPALSFTCSSDSSPSDPEAGRSSPHHGPLFSLPNSSAPALSTIPAVPATLSHRSASGPAIAKKLVFADSLSVYDTFSSTVYDRRSEPATWSRLTPALAQRIKEELNSYKMEEMEVHACSRMQ